MSMIEISVDSQELKNGLYELTWREGGTSTAAVGRDYSGKVWYAPTNWITVPSFDWDKVLRAERIR